MKQRMRVRSFFLCTNSLDMHEAKLIIHGISSKSPPTPNRVAELVTPNKQTNNPRDINFSFDLQDSAFDRIDAIPTVPQQIETLPRLGIRDHQMPYSK